jgi:uncharacterized protein (TIGR02217 family)
MSGITVLADVIVPDDVIAAGVRGKQMRRNDRARAASGKMKISVGWSRTLREYEIGITAMSVTQWQAIEALHEVTEGGAYGMLLRDPKDFTVTDASGKATLISAGDHTYQLVQRKTETSSARTKDRIVTRPKASDFILKISGTPTGSYTLDDDTGIVTIPADPAASTVTWSGPIYVPVHFREDFIDWEMVRPGSEDARLFVGPAVMLDEVRE